MGVAGCGKSTFGQALASELNLPWVEGDDFHSASNKAKMASGIALNDEDRAGWLNVLVEQIQRHPQGCVLGCSALKRSYRNVLRQAGNLRFAYLHLSKEQAAKRVSNRAGHFFSETLVESQFETLQVPADEDDVIKLDATLDTSELVQRTLKQLEAGLNQA